MSLPPLLLILMMMLLLLLVSLRFFSLPFIYFSFFFCWLYKIRLCASVFQRFTLHTILPFFNFLSPNAMRRLVCSSLLSHNIDNILVIRNMANNLSKKKMSRTRSKNQSDFLLSFPIWFASLSIIQFPTNVFSQFFSMVRSFVHRIYLDSSCSFVRSHVRKKIVETLQTKFKYFQ